MAEYLASLESDEDVQIVAHVLGEGAFPSKKGKSAVGPRTIALLASEFCEIEYERVFKPCRLATGASSEAIRKLFEYLPEARDKCKPKHLHVQQVEQIYKNLSLYSGKKDKRRLLFDTWSKMTPLEVKYFTRIVSSEALGAGIDTADVVRAIANGFNKNPVDVRYAHLLTGNLGLTAVLAKHNRLDQARFRPFHPLPFMHANTAKNISFTTTNNYVVEEHLDGMRCQIHISGNKVELYARNRNVVTHHFPEIAAFFAQLNLPDTVLDGAICVVRNNTILPLQWLQKRTEVTTPSKELMAQYPVRFIAFDLLCLGGKPLFAQPLSSRRAALEDLANQFRLSITSQEKIETQQNLKRWYQRALAHGNNGIILKPTTSPYNPFGKRSSSWVLVKKPAGLLNVVIMYVHTNNKPQDRTYFECTLGISVQLDERFEEEYIPIGKTHLGCSGKEWNLLSKQFKELTQERFGSTLRLTPSIVVELEYDYIRINNRTKAGFSLHNPFVKTIRWELAPNSVHTLRDVEQRYKEHLRQKRAQQENLPAFL